MGGVAGTVGGAGGREELFPPLPLQFQTCH